MIRRSLLPLAMLTLGLLPTTGCLDHPLKEVSLQSEGEILAGLQIDHGRKVDVLFVVDNSGSMGEEQAVLASNFSAFVEFLERPEVDADYRIGITTTDNGNPYCNGTTPEAGALQLRSCRTHLDDFVFLPGLGDEVDRREEACLESCPESLAELTTVPSRLDPTADDEQPQARPWLERGLGLTNLPEGVTTAQALACWGPQGINGCGYESPLESMYKTLLRSTRTGEAGEGFLRDDALLLVVFITDEADCSTGAGALAAFDPDGDRALWPDTDAQLAPSAVCWNAGVSCETTSEGRVHCDPVDLDANGNPANEGSEVLQPLDRYMELLYEIDEFKRRVTGQPGSQVLVSVIAGVANDGAQSIHYDTAATGEFVDNFGVGPGCTSDNGQAVPPVRLRTLAEVFDGDAGSPNLYSICNANYVQALTSIAERLPDRLRPSCIDACVQGASEIIDGDLSTCTVVHEVDGTSSSVETCRRGADGEFELTEGQDLCVYAVSGEELHPTCREAELNVELRFLRNPEARYGDVSATCEISDRPYIDCAG
ncbi:MAG: vWA domain-containing protein [Myxococcota bacterium]